MVSNITMKKEQFVPFLGLQIRVRPIPSWDHDPAKNGGFLTQLVGGGNGVHLGGGAMEFESAYEVAEWLRANPVEYSKIHADLWRSNRSIPQSYLDMCKGQEL